MLDQREAAPIVGSTVRTLQRMRSEQYGPPYYRVGGRCLYSRRELLIWLAAQRVPA